MNIVADNGRILRGPTGGRSSVADTKKHHYVSEFLLRQFSNERNQLTVHDLGGQGAYVSATRDVAHRNNAHTLASLPEIVDSNALEKAMSLLEGDVAQVIRDLMERDGSQVEAKERRSLQHFIVMHAFRHPVLSENVRREIETEYAFAVNSRTAKDQLRNVFLESLAFPALAYGEGYVSPDDEHRWSLYEDEFQDFEWTVQRYSEPSLLVGDRLVCTSGSGPRSDKSLSIAASDAGLEGLGTCMRVTLPLSPTCGLLLSRGGVLTSLRAVNFNRTTIRNSRRFVAHAPGWSDIGSATYRAAMVDLANQRAAYPELVRIGLAD